MATAAQQPVPRDQGWRRVFLAFAAVLMVQVVSPPALIVPTLAVCCLIGWRAGGRATLALLWLALAVWTLTRPAAPSEREFLDLSRGWGLMLAGSFGAVSLAATRRSFFPNALLALGMAFLLAVIVASAGSTTLGELRQVVASQVVPRGEEIIALFHRVMLAMAPPPGSGNAMRYAELLQQVEGEMRTFWGYLLRVFPALLALESLAALAVAWGLYHRLSRVRIGAPLRPLREFRFNDQLVWGVIAGIAIVFVPTLAAVRGAGLNLLVFFGMLYVVRGLAVLFWFSTAGALMITVASLLFGPLVAALAFGVGLGDTWVDWRSRARPRGPTGTPAA
jgi:hypothetical protein